jgi:hypothetical protein
MQRDPRAWLWDVRDAAASIGQSKIDFSAQRSGRNGIGSTDLPLRLISKCSFT